MAKITNCNLEASRLLGYTKNDLIDMSINNIMPKIYGDHHDGFIAKFLNSSQGNVIGKQRLVLFLHKNGYIIPCTLMIKVITNLNNGLEIVAFIK